MIVDQIEILAEFEAYTGLPPKHACLLLGIAYVTYAHYKSRSRLLPQYHIRHIGTIRMLNPKQLKMLIEEVMQ